MPSYRPPISRHQYHDLEIYYHKLVMYTHSWEFRDMKSDKQSRIHREMIYIEIALDIMGKIFVPKATMEKPVVAWRLNLKPGEPELLYRFSSIKVAAGVTGCNQSKISAVCKGLRDNTSAEGERNAKTRVITREVYKFQYEDDYEQDQTLTFDPTNTKFEFK
jgi:hypothetical protein